MAARAQPIVVVAMFALCWCLPVRAAVTEEEAARLRSDLTPLGAERVGNREGTIPAWDGGYTKVPPGYRSGDLRPDPFAEEKPLYAVTAANMNRYADKLSEGMKELLRRFRTYRLDVYPTHRTASAPQWVYDNTFANATRATVRNDGLTLEKAFGGIPFPIPKTGREAMWNHLLAWRGEAAALQAATYLASGGAPSLTVGGRAEYQFPYYDQGGSVEDFKGIFQLELSVNTRPPSAAGETFLVLHPIDQARRPDEVWAYLVGQRRVRPVPTLTYDNPDPTTSGTNYVDEFNLFRGGLDRYEWRLVGKREMLVPYSETGFFSRPVTQVLGARHLAPDAVRWELHRVWVVEATVAPGKRHPVARRRIYLDEDSWLALLYDGWDAAGRLWHVAHALPLLVPEMPGVVNPSDVIYDLQRGSYAAHFLLNGAGLEYQIRSRWPEDHFTPAAMVSEGVR